MLALSRELLMAYAFTHEHKNLVGLAICHVTETLVLVQEAYGNKALNQSNVFRCYSWFQDRRELVEDDERGGNP